jgi:Flagellar protein FliT
LTEPYQRLLTLAKLEHELALQGDVEGLERLDSERRQIVAALPARPPAAAKPLLVEMASIQAETTRVLMEAKRELAAEMGEVDRTSATAQSYGLQATPRSGTFSAAV